MIKTSFQDFEKRDLYLSASEIASIVKHFKNKDFNVYDDFDLILSKKLWSDEEKIQYANVFELKNERLFKVGHLAENEFKYFFNKKLAQRDNISEEEALQKIYHFADTGKTLVCKDLRISATPDFLIPNNDGSKYHLVEIKSGNFFTKNIEQYKYQVAQQFLLLSGTNYKINKISIFFYSSFKKSENYQLQISKQEIDLLQDEIIECIPLFYEALEKKDFNFISFDNAIEKLNSVYLETNIDISNKIDELFLLEGQNEELSQKISFLKDFFLEHYKDASLTGKTQFSNGLNKISYIRVKDIIKDTKYYDSQIQKKKKEIELLELEKSSINKDSLEVQKRKSYIKITRSILE